MLAGDFRNLHPTEHSGNLFDPSRLIERNHPATRLTVLIAFDDLPLPIGTGSHLREVCNT